jgi:hypothetical protein
LSKITTVDSTESSTVTQAIFSKAQRKHLFNGSEISQTDLHIFAFTGLIKSEFFHAEEYKKLDIKVHVATKTADVMLK